MSRLNAGETEITIGSEKLIFRPSLRVAKDLNRVFGALGSVIEKLRIADLDAVNSVIKICAGIDDKRSRLIEEWVWEEMGRSDTSFGSCWEISLTLSRLFSEVVGLCFSRVMSSRRATRETNNHRGLL